MTSDIIDRLADVAPGSPGDGLRQRRAQARTNAQASYDSLFTAPDQTGVSLTERLVVATFVCSLHGAARAHDHYRGLLLASAGREVADLVDQVATEGDAQGPYGRFPDSVSLRDEDSSSLSTPWRLIPWEIDSRQRSSTHTCWSFVRVSPPLKHLQRS